MYCNEIIFRFIARGKANADSGGSEWQKDSGDQSSHHSLDPSTFLIFSSGSPFPRWFTFCLQQQRVDFSFFYGPSRPSSRDLRESFATLLLAALTTLTRFSYILTNSNHGFIIIPSYLLLPPLLVSKSNTHSFKISLISPYQINSLILCTYLYGFSLFFGCLQSTYASHPQD